MDVIIDGQQHFKYVSIWNNDLIETQRRDNLKTQYCLDNNIKLIRISYLQNITNILLKENIINYTVPNCPKF
jgi:hypothetical protein